MTVCGFGSHLYHCHTAACCRTGTEPSVLHSTFPRSEALDQSTPCGRTPPHLHMSWSTAATVPMRSSCHPRRSVVRARKSQRHPGSRLGLRAKDNLSGAAQTTVWASGFRATQHVSTASLRTKFVLKGGTRLLSASAHIPAPCVTHQHWNLRSCSYVWSKPGVCLLVSMPDVLWVWTSKHACCQRGLKNRCVQHQGKISGQLKWNARMFKSSRNKSEKTQLLLLNTLNSKAAVICP